uniref:Protein kinase domain-containing protein n=1 Tax=Guillardia theta (strain CCMP2712) TaxID=905079 RepID=A0A0C3UEU4_GUITC
MFECLSIVGKGAYGKVLQFERELQERENLRGIINVDKSVYKRWLVQSTKAERRVLEVVNHPFIVKLHYAFQTADRLCLVMDFINGGELFSYIAREKVFSEPRARFYAAEIILALEYLHEMSIIYRDLKPENILLDDKGHIRLTDFGHSKDEHSRNDRAFSMVGSPYYMAPEILLNKGHGKEADWWSLGILVYEMLVGLPPFYQENTKKAYEALLTKPLEFPENISREAKSMIRGLVRGGMDGWIDGGREEDERWGEGGVEEEVCVCVCGGGGVGELKIDVCFSCMLIVAKDLA